MMNKTFRLSTLIGLVIVVAFNVLSAQNTLNLNTKSSKAIFLGKTKPYSEVPSMEILPNNDKKKSKKSHFPKIVDNFLGAAPMPIVNANALPNGPDPLRKLKSQSTEDVGLQIETSVNIEGINSSVSNSVPPDPVGHINGEYFVQMTNAGGGAAMFVTDKDGNTVSNPISMGFIWGQLNVTAGGDPIVLWDQEKERWVVCELGGNLSTFLFAVSETSDPLGSYYAYQIASTDGEIPDYPKFGIWNDAYYLTTNEPSKPNVPVYVINRDAVTVGSPSADFQIIQIPKFVTGVNTFQVVSAADWDGVVPPPAGSPQYLMRIHDDAWGSGTDRIEIWEIDVDFDNASNTTLTGPLNLPTAPFDATLCGSGNIFDCIDQGNGDLVSALQHVIMHRPQYRNFGSYEAMVLNFSVDVSGSDNAGIRWMELRKMPGGDWFIYQEGTFAPENDLNYFMASIAMDGSGGIAMGYSVMGPNKFPSQRITGRRNSDPLGEMTFDELEIATGGTWNQTFRWGDYAAMTVDPTDERTFWYTGEYIRANGGWGTKIACFFLSRDTVDMAAVSLIEPVNSAFLTGTETVTATFTNRGLEAQSNFEVGYMIDNILVGTEIITQNVMPDSSINVTFTATADLSVIKDHEFKVFSGLLDDQYILNDTFRTIVTKLPRFDAAVTNFPGTEIPLCDDNTDLGIEITNVGVEDLTSVEIIWSYNSGVEQTINWTGNLASGATDVVSISLTGLVDGSNTISARTEKPNGMVDENMANDLLGRDVNAFLTAPRYLNLEINLDNAPQEVTWELRNDEDMVLFTGGPYSPSQANTQVNEQICIIDDCYNFIMLDAGGDGLCCASGQGSYLLTDENDVYLAQGANYGSQEATDFCFPFVCFLESSVNVLNEAGPGVGNGVIFLASNNGMAPVMYSIDGGANFTTNGFFGGLDGGVYQVVLIDAQNCRIEFEVLVGTCAIEFTADIQGVSVAGAMDGSITVDATSGVTPLSYSIDGGATSQADPFFPNLEEGNYLIEVRDSINCTKVLSVTVGLATAVKDLIFGHSVNVRPNPTDGVFYLEAKGVDDVWTIDTEIIDINGRVIQRGTLTRFDGVFTGRMSLYLYPAGVYFVRLLHPDFKELYKVVRN